MIDLEQRNDYLAAMQIDTWTPRTSLPFAKSLVKDVSSSNSNSTLEYCVEETTPAIIAEKIEQAPIIIPEKDIPEEIAPQGSTLNIPHFSLQLMQAGHCLLLIERSAAMPFQIKDPAYQLLRNILYAAKLPDTPQPLGDLIQWPLFKQSTIPQGKLEAQEFLQSFIMTYKEQFTDTRCLWLMGSSSVCYAADFNESNYFESPMIEPYGQLLLSPSLDMLMTTPTLKASLWHSIRKLIHLWQS